MFHIHRCKYKFANEAAITAQRTSSRGATAAAAAISLHILLSLSRKILWGMEVVKESGFCRIIGTPLDCCIQMILVDDDTPSKINLERFGQELAQLFWSL